MSSSFIVDAHQGSSKKDDTLIIVVNDDGTISVDQETLQNLIMNQADAKVSVVRVGQSEGDTESGDLTLTVDPPSFERSITDGASVTVAAPTDVTGLVDPFMEMDPDQLEKLETALQSEQAKQILGENVTAMLDMLTVEEQQKSIKYCIELDHCYTSRTCPTDPEPSDPLPIANSPDIVDDVEPKHASQQSSSIVVHSAETSVGDASMTPVRSKILSRNTATRSAVGRGRKIAAPVVQPTSGSKTPPALSPRSSSTQQSPNKGVSTSARVEAERKDNDSPSTTSESSESEPPSDDDSDFGPRGPRRGGVRARGGRKGLTTRGGSAGASRRRSANKQMDMEQVRRLDMEMAAAVVAMKSPEKSERPERFTPVRAKKRTRSVGGRKKEDSSPNRGTSMSTNLISPPSPSLSEAAPIVEKPLQTTNQVKANLINANMIKGDMVLTKPGQARNNQKVLFVQKKVMVRPNEMRTFGLKRQSLVLGKSGKTMPLSVQTKLTTSEDGKFISMGGKTVQSDMEIENEAKTSSIEPTTMIVSSSSASPAIIGLEQQQQPPRIETPPSQLPQQLLQHESTPEVPGETTATPSPPLRIKTTEVKREKKKSESEVKEETLKVPDVKTPDVSKKHLKREPRKAPAVLADTLGPALFSTPDIIRRVGSDAKSSDSPGTPPVSQTPTSGQNLPIASPDHLASSAASLKRQDQIPSGVAEMQVGQSTDTLVSAQTGNESPSRVKNDQVKSDAKAPTVEELEPSLDPATNVTPIVDNPEPVRSADAPVVPNEIIPEQSGIEGEEHLLATLEMEASKHDEELLAEALLLQEELGVDLADHPALSESTGAINESLLSPSTPFEATMETTEKRPEVVAKMSDTSKSRELSSEIASSLSSPKIPSSLVETPKKRDEKEPIQIIRGGRVITLPPIEAPATRSKRLQGKPGTPPKLVEPPKKDETITKQPVQKAEEPIAENPIAEHDVNQVENEDDDDDDDEEEDNSDSEDDPDRLWCICKRPHNNRFMICCDVCEDWFHGKCVHVSKAMGQQMEEKGIEWVCPNCAKKKDQSLPSSEQKKAQSMPGKRPSTPFEMESDRPPRASAARPNVTPSEKIRKAPPSQPVLFEPTLPTIPTSLAGVTQCVVCKKEARNSSIYCSDACILAHAQETLTRDSKPSVQAKVSQGSSETPPKVTTDARVIVFERRTGKVLTGTDAPTRSNLKTWLKEHPTFEVVRPNNLNTLQIGGKTVTAIQTQGVGKIVKTTQGTSPGAQSKMVYTKVLGSKQTVLAPSNKKLVVLSGGQQRLSPKTIQPQKPQGSPSAGKSPVMRQTTIKIVPQPGKSPTTIPQRQTNTKKPEVAKIPSTSQQQQSQQEQKPVVKAPLVKKAEPEPIRLNVRKTLAELLTTRIRDSKDLTLSDEEISDLALNIELELYKYFRDTGAKYKSKYRSLVFNIKDTKNLTLFRKIADRSLSPDAVVRLSPDEMASQELAEWREKETKHQLEMIKKNELDLMSQAKSIVVKTHKGELIIENETGIDRVDPKTPVQDIVTVLNSHEAGNDDANEEANKPGHSMSSEDTKWSRSNVNIDANTSSDDRKKRDKDRSREKDRGGEGKSRSTEKEGEKTSRSKRLEEEDGGEGDERRRRSHSRGRSRRSRDRERSRDRKSTRSKERKRNGERDGKERERRKSGKESRQRDKERDRRSRGKNKDRKSRSGRDEDVGRSRRDASDKKGDNSGQQTGNADDVKPIEDRLWRHVEEDTTTSTIAQTAATTNNANFDGNDSDLSDREPSSTVNIKTPDINDEAEKEREAPATIGEASQLQKQQNSQKPGQSQTVWRGFVNMVDVAKFFITAQEVSGHARDLMEDLPDTVDVIGRISHETVWDYISKMKKTGSKEILVIRLTAANDEEKIPYITLYSYLNSRSRLGVVGNVSKNIKDFYIMPFSRQSQIPQVLLPLVGPGFEDQRPHLLLGIIVRNKRKRVSNVSSPVTAPPAKLMKKDDDNTTMDKSAIRHPHHHHQQHHHHHHQLHQSPPDSPRPLHKGMLLESLREKQVNVTQMTLESLNKAHVGMSRSTILDNAAISKLVPELSSKIDLSESPKIDTPPLMSLSASPRAANIADGLGGGDDDDDGDEPYSPGGGIDVDDTEDQVRLRNANIMDVNSSSILSPMKNSTELQRKMDELNRQIEEQKQQIQSISSSFLGDAANTLPGLGLDPPNVGDSDEAYSPTDTRSFTPPPPGIAKFAQPILDKVSDITIPPNLQEILANVKRQESSKIDPYLPSKPSATFLTTSNSPIYPLKTTEKYTPTFINKNTTAPQSPMDNSSSPLPSASVKETKSTLRSLSDLDLIKKAEEELAAVAAATAAATAAAVGTTPTILPQIDTVPIPPPTFSSPPPPPPPPPPPTSKNMDVAAEPAIPEVREKTSEVVASYAPPNVAEKKCGSSDKKTGSASLVSLEQPKPPGLEDEDLPVIFPSAPPPAIVEASETTSQKLTPKSGVVTCVKRKFNDDDASATSPTKAPRTKSR